MCHQITSLFNIQTAIYETILLRIYKMNNKRLCSSSIQAIDKNNKHYQYLIITLILN